VLVPFTHSITRGIGPGVATDVPTTLLDGKARDVTVVPWVAFVALVVCFACDPLTQLLGVG